MNAALDDFRALELPEESNAAEALVDIDMSVQRATELTTSLLAFGRKRGDRLERVDLTAALERSRPLLQRASGPGIEVTLDAAPGPLTVIADATQIDVVLLNLVVNARDALEGNGTIHITQAARTLLSDDAERPAELAPGEYVAVSVHDDGPGIDV